MGTRITFQSIGNVGKYGYTWLKDSWNSEYAIISNHGLAREALMFETYGDGMTQHSSSYPVSTARSEDYLCSMAKHVVENPDCIEVLEYSWPHMDSDTETINLALSIKYKEGKAQYYNLADRKITTSASKQYDKRWEEVKPWMDGTGLSAFRILAKSYYGAIERHMLYQAIRKATNYTWVDWDNELQGMGRHEKASIDIIQECVEAFRLQKNAQNGMECLLHNLANDKKIAEQAEKIA